jgi:predicted nucleotidyltransferase
MTHVDTNTEEAVRRFLELIRERYDIVGAILYGSRATGTHNNESDADLAVILKGEPRHYKTVMDMAKSSFRVLLEKRIPISPLPIWLDEWEHPETYSNPALLYHIRHVGIHL